MANNKNITFNQLEASMTKVKAEIDKKANTNHGTHVPTTGTANNATYLRNDNQWHKIVPSDIGAAPISHGDHVTYSNTSPSAPGTASAGSAANVSRGDHVHPLQTTVSGNAGTATKLQTARTLTIGNTGKSFDGSGNVSWSLDEIGAVSPSHTHDRLIENNNNITLSQANDRCGLDAVNNVNVATWYGFSISNNCSNTDNYGQVTFSVDARSGQVWTRGTVNAPGFSGALYGNANTATTLANSRKFTIGNTERYFNGSSDVSWSLDEMGVTSAIQVAENDAKMDIRHNYVTKHEAAHYFEGENKWKLDVYSLGTLSSTVSPTKQTMIQNNCLYLHSVLVDHPNYQANYSDNYVGYATTYMHFTEAYQWTGRVVTDDYGSVYLNDVLVLNTESCQYKDITLNFTSGWNKLEVLYAEGGGGDGWQFDPEIVVVPGGIMNKMNCYGQNSIVEHFKDEINNIRIGGTNLFRGTTNLDSPYWIGENASLTDSYYRGSRIYRVSYAWADYSYPVRYLFEDDVIELNTEYTFSCYARTNNGDYRPNLGIYGDSAHMEGNGLYIGTVGTEWRQYSGIIKFYDGNRDYPLRIEPATESGDNNKYIEVCGLKLEKGNKATDWSPNPNDINIVNPNLLRNGRFKGIQPNAVDNVPDWIASGGVTVWTSIGQPGYDRYGCIYFHKSVCDGAGCYLYQDLDIDNIERNVPLTLSFDAWREGSIAEVGCRIEYLNANKDAILASKNLNVNDFDGHRSYTFATSNDGNVKYLRVVFYYISADGASGGYLVTLGNVKLEHGMCETAWSQSQYERISKEGIKVYHNDIDGNSYTHMAPGGFYINNKGTDIFKVDGNGLYIKGNGDFTGKVTANDGSIGGFTISSGKLVGTGGNGVGMSGNGDDWAFWAGASTGGNAPFHVGHEGHLYATNATLAGTLDGNATTATRLQNARTLTIGNTGKNFDGTGNISWSLDEIGAAASGHTHDGISSSNTYITTVGNDTYSLDMPNNIDISSWFGVSITNNCANTPNYRQTTVAINARSGEASFRGSITAHGAYMTNNIVFSEAGSSNSSSPGLVWNGSTDGADLYYRTLEADQGQLLINLRDDNNATLAIAWNGEVKATFDANGYYSGSCYKASCLNARNITVGKTTKAFDGTNNVSWSIDEIGAAPSSHGHNFMYVKGTNTIGSVNDDTTGNWGAQQNSVHWYSGVEGCLHDQPSSWGYLLNIGQGSEVHQLWMTQASGNLLHRGGNGSGWSGSWKTILDSDNFTAYAAPSNHTHNYAASNHNHDSAYLKLSGGTLSGSLTVNNNVYSQGFCISKNNKEVWLDIGDNDTYIWASGANKSLQITHGGDLNFDGKPILYGGRGNNYDTALSTIYFNNSGQNHKGRISCYNDEANGEHVHIGLRTADTTVNYLLLREDTIRIKPNNILFNDKRLTISSSAPSNPNTGDVWINIG